MVIWWRCIKLMFASARVGEVEECGDLPLVGSNP